MRLLLALGGTQDAALGAGATAMLATLIAACVSLLAATAVLALCFKSSQPQPPPVQPQQPPPPPPPPVAPPRYPHHQRPPVQANGHTDPSQAYPPPDRSGKGYGPPHGAAPQAHAQNAYLQHPPHQHPNSHPHRPPPPGHAQRPGAPAPNMPPDIIRTNMPGGGALPQQPQVHHQQQHQPQPDSPTLPRYGKPAQQHLNGVPPGARSPHADQHASQPSGPRRSTPPSQPPPVQQQPPPYPPAINPSRPSNQEPSQQPVHRQAPQWPAQQPHGLRSKPSVDMETAPSDMSAFTGAPSMPSADLDKAGINPQALSADLYMEAPTVEAAVDLLHRVCDRMQGSVQKPACILQRQTIRAGVHAAVAEVSRLGVPMTVLFFTSPDNKSRHVRCSTRALKSFMLSVSEEHEEGLHTAHGASAWLPAHIYVARCETIPEALRRCDSPRDALHEMLTICLHLAEQLHELHRRHMAVRDITFRNVVRGTVGLDKRWTLLEYSSAHRAGRRVAALPARLCTPEQAERRHTGQFTIDTPFDMWQFGTFLYEVASGAPYWPHDMPDDRIYATLANPGAPLPHETRPVAAELAQRVCAELLRRDPAARPTATALRDSLKSEEQGPTLTGTMNAEGPVQFERTIVMDPNNTRQR